MILQYVSSLAEDFCHVCSCILINKQESSHVMQPDFLVRYGYLSCGKMLQVEVFSIYGVLDFLAIR